MSANMMRFEAKNEPAWWDTAVNHVFTDEPTPTEAMARIGLDYEVVKLPLNVNLPDGTRYAVPGRVALVRPPIGGPSNISGDGRDANTDGYEVLSIVSSRYEVVQNMDIARTAEGITSAKGWHVETLGAIGAGEKVFMMIASGEAEVGGETFRNYYLLHDDKTGGGSLWLAFTPVRVVCQNTLSAGLEAARVKIEIQHRAGARADLEWYTQYLHRVEAAQEATFAAYEAMMKTGLGTRREYRERKVDAAVQAVFPLPNLNSKAEAALRYTPEEFTAMGMKEAQWKAAQKALKDFEFYRDVQTRYQTWAREALEVFNEAHPAHANTVWALYNACTETSDWRPGRESVAQSVLVGARADEKVRAFRICHEFAKN